MIADRTGWRGSLRASLSILLRARYRRAASALRMARGTGLAGRPRSLPAERPVGGLGFVVADPVASRSRGSLCLPAHVVAPMLLL